MLSDGASERVLVAVAEAHADVEVHALDDGDDAALETSAVEEGDTANDPEGKDDGVSVATKGEGVTVPLQLRLLDAVALARPAVDAERSGERDALPSLGE